MENFLAPDLLDTRFAGELGKYLSYIFNRENGLTGEHSASDMEELLRLFEMPEYGKSLISSSVLLGAMRRVLGSDECAQTLELLLNAGILTQVPMITAQYSPTCRLNRCSATSSKDIFVCTDSPVSELRERVFPWADEGEVLARSILNIWNGNPPKTILDVCAGAGTVGLLLGTHWAETTITAIDNNRRARTYAEFNVKLNGLSDRYEYIELDLLNRDRILPALGSKMYDIVAIDPPFAPMPDEVLGFSHSNVNILDVALKLGLEHVRIGGLLVLLCYSFGTEEQPTQIKDILAKSKLSKFTSYQIEPVQGPLWRLYGEKSNPLNPMPVQYMAPRFYDPDWRSKFAEAKNYDYAKYVNWIEQKYVKCKLTHLHYVLVILTKSS